MEIFKLGRASIKEQKEVEQFLIDELQIEREIMNEMCGGNI